MNLISVKDLGHGEGGKTLFSDITFGIDEGDKIALTGRNGSGKSTLLRLISKLKRADTGAVVHNSELKCAFLDQQPVFSPSDKIADFVLSGNSREINLIREYETITGVIGEDSSYAERLENVMTELYRLDCWSLEHRIHSILSELGINDLSQRMEELSGGMVKKVSIARTLVTESNLVILDEPTNHLDIETIYWLEKYLKNSGKAVVLVTHDRYFMDSVCSSVMEIENGNLYTYKGNYSLYLQQKADRENARQKAAARTENFLRNEVEWILRGPRARAGKDKKRTARFFDLKNSRPEKQTESDDFSVEGRRLGGKILELENVGKSYGDNRLFSGFSFSFKKGDRIGILGANGSGKTTLLNILVGKIEPDEGTVDTGVNTKIGYYDQLSHDLPGAVKVIDYIKETAEIITLKDGSRLSPNQFLERFLFPKDMIYTEIANLSGGEKKKLYLLKILLENPNFLLFDEPTNDFDIQTLSILEDFLGKFYGCIVVVSHDRFFLDRTTDFLFVLDSAGGISGYSGDVMSYYGKTKAELNEESEKSNQKSSRPSSGKKTVNRQKKGLSFSEKKELETVEEEIIRLEEEKEQLDQYFISSSAGGSDLGDKKIKYDNICSEIEEKYKRWEYLEAEKG